MIPEDLLRQNGINLPSYAPGRYYTTCPKCSHLRSTANRKEKCLGVTIEADNSVRFGCNHCTWTGPEKGNGAHARGNGADRELPFHVYRDKNGVIQFRKVRNTPGRKPKCWFEHREGVGQWVKGAGAADTSILYRIDEVTKAIAEGRVIVCAEGEKDVDRLWRFGFAACCNAHGAPDPTKNQKPKWTKAHSEQLRGADIVVLNDNDPAGYDHADATCKLSVGVARRIRRLDLALHWPNIPKGGDVSDWIAAGHTRDELEALIAGAPDYEPAPAAPGAQTGAGFEDTVALKFADRHADNFRYIAKISKWMIWRLVCWRAEDTLAAFAAARVLCREAGKADAKVVAAVEKLAKSDRRIASEIEQWDADNLLAGTPAGTVDLTTGELRTARREDYITKLTAVAPAPPGCPPPDRWLAFLDTVFNKNDDLIDFVQRLLGYFLTGDISEHIFAFLFGTGRNGKGTFLRTVSGVMGDYANTSPIEAFLESKYDRHPTELARLHKIRLTVAQETPKGRAWDEAKIKNTTGGDPIPARFMRGDFFDFDPTHKLAIAGNHKPKLKVVDEAIRARLMLIPFAVTIPEKDRDPDLTENLKAEWPQILRWIIDGTLKWRRDGLGVPPIVREASSNYFHEQDAIAHWIDDATERKQLAKTSSSVLFASWKKWAAPRGVDVGTERAFAFAMQDRGWTLKRVAKGRFFLDIVLKETPADEDEKDLLSS